MKKIKNKLYIILSIFILLIIYKYFFFVALIFPTLFDIENHGNNLYIEENISKIEQEEIKELLVQSKTRIINRRGSFYSSPRIIIVDSDKKSDLYNLGIYPGKTHFSFFGTYVVLKHNKGDNIDVMAHEMMHAELIHRLGYINRTLKIPVWFDEGLAMQVDGRKKYDINEGEYSDDKINSVKNKKSVSSFWSDGEKQILENYIFSKYVVKKIIEKTGEDKVYENLERIKNGEKFENIFR